MQRGELDRYARPQHQRFRARRIERPGCLSDGLDRVRVALLIARGVALGARGFAEHVIGNGVALLLVRPGVRDRRLDRSTEHELVAENAHSLP
jgi:hypothetical protein